MFGFRRQSRRTLIWLFLALTLSLGFGACSPGGSGSDAHSGDGASSGSGSSPTQTLTAPVDTANGVYALQELWAVLGNGTGGGTTPFVSKNANGDAILAMSFAGTRDFGCGQLTTTGSNHGVMLGEFDAVSGACKWSVVYESSNYSLYLISVEVDHHSDIVVTGSYANGTATAGGATFPAADGYGNAFVAKYSGADGHHLWSFPVVAPQNVAAWATVDSSDDVYVTGGYTGAASFGGVPFPQYGFLSMFLARLHGSDGTVAWSRTWGQTNLAISGARLAFSPSDDLYLFGQLQHGTLALGNGATADSYFMAKFDRATGTPIWSNKIGPNFNFGVTSVATDAAGDLYLAGAYYINGDLGGGPFPYFGDTDAFLAKMAGSDGHHIWSRPFGSSRYDVFRSLDINDQGQIAVTGATGITGYDPAGNVLDLGGGPLPYGGFSDAILAVYSAADGAHLFSTIESDNSYSNGQSLKWDGAGHLLISGCCRTYGGFMFKYAFDFANQSPQSSAGPDQMVHTGSAVTLDGTGSSDPDGDLPLTFSWSFASKPAGSTAVLIDADTPLPSFNADFTGDYVVQLVVTDSRGGISNPDTVLVSTVNVPPIADAGPDQALIVLGSLVTLDGSQSRDDEGDSFTYDWHFTAVPAGSVATLSSASAQKPTFTADVQGTYTVQLVVTDQFGGVSAPDLVFISFANVAPVAVAGPNQAVVIGDSVALDGTGSSDANGDPLAYAWSFVALPPGSASLLSSASAAMSGFQTDVPGTYVVQLVVNDGFVNSAPSQVTIVAVAGQAAATATLMDTIDLINALPAVSADGTPVLKNANMSNALTNKINAALAQIDSGNYQQAYDKLTTDILQKTDGCATSGAPDNNDWIQTCPEQASVYGIIMQAISYLETLL